MISAFDQRTLPAVLAERAAEHAGRPLLHDDLGILSYGEAWAAVRALSAGLAGLGVSKGDRVVIALSNRREFVLAWFAAATLGALEVPTNPLLIGDALRHVISHSQARLAIVEGEMLAELDRLADELTDLESVIVVGSERSERFACTPFDEVSVSGIADVVEMPAAVRAGDPVAVMYTSGTSGPAKGVVMPHGQHHANGVQAVRAAGITADDVVFVCLPLHHNMAQGYGVWPAVLAGAAVRLTRKFDRATFWGDVRACGATVLPFVGVLLALLDAQPARDDDHDNPLRVAYGVPVPADLHEPFEQRFGLTVLHAYGSTEATIPVWGGAVGATRVVGAAGRPIDGYAIRIVDDEDRPLPPGQVGEICVRSDEPFTMFSGYFRDPERTLAVITNLWFHTGDRGEFDAVGNLFFRGRGGDVIRRFGEFIDAAQIEAAVEAHPAVLTAAAFATPSELAEDEVMVAVVARDGQVVTPDDVRAAVRARMVAHAVPRFVELVDELPLTPTGKVEKYKLRARGVSERTHDARQHLGGLR
jgi:crotonobetaine/carnitine-CoA ligase